MMADQLSMFFEMQGAMVGLIFLASNYYIWLSMKRIEGVERVRMTDLRSDRDGACSLCDDEGMDAIIPFRIRARWRFLLPLAAGCRWSSAVSFR